ncbi:hypothetical protein ACFWXO_36800 [Kitasatospora sp. NPDC059088]|uniref:hypothetical protein n=1 Tax=Kitasatospora sp. NPDC059088 TaxID=3346722 RepID=UPI003698D60A
MNIIVAGQRVVTALDLIEAAGYEPAPAFEPRTAEDIAAYRDALVDLIDDLADIADTEDDDLDLAHYRQLLRRMPTPLRNRDLVVARRPKARKAVAA